MRRRRSTVTLDVEIELSQIDTKDLVDELKSRGKSEDEPHRDDLADIHAALIRGNVADALSALERILWPKWRSPAECEAELAKQRKAA